MSNKQPMFSGITKGEWKVEGYSVDCNNEIICWATDSDCGEVFKNHEQNNELIAYAGNLAQRVNLEYVDDLIKETKNTVNEIKKQCFHESGAYFIDYEGLLTSLEEIINKLEVKQ